MGLSRDLVSGRTRGQGERRAADMGVYPEVPERITILPRV
jgi:hypothetical protein